MKIYIDGAYYDEAEAKISVFDHGLLYGDGVFEGLRIYHGKVFKLREHVQRLYQSAKVLLLDIPMGPEEMEKVVVDAVKKNEKHNGYIRLIVTRGRGSMGLDPDNCKKPSVIIIVCDIQLYPEEFYRRGIEIVTAASRRMPADSLEPRVKSLNYLNNIMAKLEAHQAGCLEAVMLNHEGLVAECTADNIFVVKDGVLLTPAPYYGALDGITMRTVQELATGTGIAVRETALTRYDLYNADECFMTGSGAEIVPVVAVDKRKIGNGEPGPVTTRLIAEFRRLVSE